MGTKIHDNAFGFNDLIVRSIIEINSPDTKIRKVIKISLRLIFLLSFQSAIIKTIVHIKRIVATAIDKQEFLTSWNHTLIQFGCIIRSACGKSNNFAPKVPLNNETI